MYANASFVEPVERSPDCRSAFGKHRRQPISDHAPPGRLRAYQRILPSAQQRSSTAQTPARLSANIDVNPAAVVRRRNNCALISEVGFHGRKSRRERDDR
jgi:hypothetical protein